MWQGRGELDIVNQAEVVDHFRSVREDLDRMTQGLSLLEVVDQLAQERHPDPRLYPMLVGALRPSTTRTRDPTWSPPAFFLKALVLEGARPGARLRAPRAGGGRGPGGGELVAFDLTEGGALCRRCRRGRP